MTEKLKKGADQSDYSGVQESFEAMRMEFAKQAEAFLAWSADVKRDLAMSESIGTLEEELEAIEKMQATIKEKEAELLAALEEAHTQLADNNLSAHSHTKVTIGECQEDMELLPLAEALLERA